ncbi:hypothetical protein AAKU67_004337 [Oxalobacteraceae bacterium GrIS 2.11]
MKTESIAEQLFFTTIRIDTISADGTPGSGTGFFFTHKISDKDYIFIVTNKHVVMGMREGKLNFVTHNGNTPKLGDGFSFQIDQQQWPTFWFGHPDNGIDIAITPLMPLVESAKQRHNVDLFFRSVPSSLIPDSKQIEDLDAVESVTFVGYPNGLWDSKNFLPIARRGTTASPLQIDFEGTPRFIIDASVFGGSSGSPVFIFNQGSWSNKDGNLHAGSRIFFVGVIAAVFYRTQQNQIIPIPIPTQTKSIVEQHEMIDLGIVFKGRVVVETVEALLRQLNLIDGTTPVV